ncbi:TonB-dependent receptor family protein [Thalassotalea agarivorans]|uniref:Fe(3+) dicitrate transport protein n=1 Tax=Thalassotalea agarivorans TaxID=349064 RepID=A0A1I0B288_THASX|nr:TonB-dependent receptor [Thalassotalea agarivorans]SET00828.1 Fe(3+) dicitrate transport protein [Thalassotalea agarivorans]
MMFRKSAITLALLSTVSMPLSVTAEENVNDDASNTANEALVERLQIIGHGDRLRTEAGSATLIGEVELEKFKFDDINRILYSVPGVNIREEDGFGLRPNIGFRGATPERSKKITIMEDGVLIGPAPYSAPAAYYFPMTNKMTSIEVFKGPAATKYGPNTVAGALNMTTRQVPEDSEGQIEVAAGNFGFGKVQAHYGNTIGRFGFVIDAVHLQSIGFKELDGGGDTGFDKNDVMAKFSYDLSSDSLNQLVSVKLGYSSETSDETYLGLTDDDFGASPNRRYVASQKDLMDWDHQQVQFTHFIGNDTFDVTTHVYRNDFSRSWFKLNGFKGGLVNADVQEVLANPYDDANFPFYQVLTGQRDSVEEYEKIILGDNYREYYSQGIQSEFHYALNLFGFDHKLNGGVRFHQDQIQRFHTEDAFIMQSAQLISDGSDTVATTTNLEESDAISVFLQDTLTFDKLALTFGVRGEFIDSYYQNKKPGQEGDWLKKSTQIWLPSVSGFYTITDSFGLLFGVHEGFIPTSPQESPEIDVENSISYEFGTRFNNGHTQFEAVAFFNDYENLKESCSFSAASSCGDSLDQEFNGGEVDVYGLELSTSHSFNVTDSIELPLSLVYTYSHGEFKSDFSSDFPMWGDITAGDELPYLPEHQASLTIGLVGDVWEFNVISRYVGDMLEASGENVTLSGVSTNSLVTVDLAASYDLDTLGKVYIKVDNVTDNQEITSRRPYGARPSKPQMVQVGYQYSF